MQKVIPDIFGQFPISSDLFHSVLKSDNQPNANKDKEKLVITFFDSVFCEQNRNIAYITERLHEDFIHISKNEKLCKTEYLAFLAQLPDAYSSSTDLLEREVISTDSYVILRLTLFNTLSNEIKMIGAAMYKTFENQIQEQFIVWS